MRVFVVGASSDIGLAICRKFLSEGWEVLAHYRTQRLELEFLARANPKKVDLVEIAFDDPLLIEENLARHKINYAKCDAMVNCAAAHEPRKFCDINASSIMHNFSVNVLPGLLIVRDMVPAMKQKKWGRMIHLSSVGVKFGGGTESFCYSLSKHTLEFMPADYKGWAADNIFLNVVRVGVTDTRIHNLNPSKNMAKRIEMIPAKRMATADEISKTVWFLGSQENSYITGQVISISGGE